MGRRMPFPHRWPVKRRAAKQNETLYLSAAERELVRSSGGWQAAERALRLGRSQEQGRVLPEPRQQARKISSFRRKRASRSRLGRPQASINFQEESAAELAALSCSLSYCSASTCCRTSFACPLALTPSHIFSIFPSGPISALLLTIPL